MPIDDRDPARGAQALRAAMNDALATRSAANRPDPPDRVDPDWLGVGIWLGLMHPQEARQMLELIDAGTADQLTIAQASGTPAAADDTAGVAEPEVEERLQVTSMLLARAANMPEPESEVQGRDSRFGWAARLTRAEILAAGQVVSDMIANGAPDDLARGFGIAWDGGVRIPRNDRDALLAQFVELEITVAEVLTGRDLRPAEPTPRPSGLSALFGSWLARSNPADAEVTAAIEHAGEAARLGLIALWNAWAAMRFRSLIPRSTFDLLVEPWVRVVGALDEP